MAGPLAPGGRRSCARRTPCCGFDDARDDALVIGHPSFETAEGLVLTGLEEHRSVPYLALPRLMEPVPDGSGEHRLREHPERLAPTCTPQAVRPGGR